MTQSNLTDTEIIEQAAAWHAASGDDAMDWDAFTLWLEADPRHRDRYDEVAMADALLDDHRDALRVAAVDAAPVAPRRPWRVWFGTGAVAAAVALIVLLPTWHNGSAQTTDAGDAMRTLALADGSQVTLAPHGRLTVNGDQMTLNGQARFAIRHDPSRALHISAGGLTISDIGTTFDVVSSGTTVRVAVSEGTVAVSGGAIPASVQLGQGEGLIVGDGTGVRMAPGRALGLDGWTGGTISYDNAPLRLVADDVARLTGQSLELSPALQDRRFSGSLKLAAGSRTAQDLAKLMDLRLDRASGKLVLEAGPGNR